MKKIIRWSYRIFFVILLIGTILFQYNVNYNINKEPPSNKWAKGIKISNIKTNNFPQISKEGDKYIVAFNNGKQIKILELDILGKIHKEKNIDINTESIQNINFLKQNDGNYYMDWNKISLENNDTNYIILDSKFNKIKEGVIKDIVSSSQLDNNLILRSYNDKIQILDVKEGKSFYINAKSPSFIKGTKFEDKYIISFMSGKSQMKYFYYNKGQISPIEDACKIGARDGDFIMNLDFATEGKYGYFFVERKNKEGVTTEINTFSLDGKEDTSRNIFKVQGMDEVISFNTKYSKKGEAVVVVTGKRPFGIKKQYEDLAEVSINNKKAVVKDFISKSNELSMFGKTYNDEIAIYCDYKPEDESYDVYFTSTDKKFKKLHNNVLDIEKNITKKDTIQEVIYSFVYLFIIAIRWIVPGVLIMAIPTFLEYKLKDKWKKILFVVACIITSFLKIKFMYEISYVKFAYNLPTQLQSSTLGIALNILFSLISYSCAYLTYSENVDGVIPVLTFFPYLLMDSILTLLLFSPYLL